MTDIYAWGNGISGQLGLPGEKVRARGRAVMALLSLASNERAE